MNLHNRISTNMEYIQKLFLGVQDYFQANHQLEELFTFLDAEPPQFRSVAYESASMEIGLQELSGGRELNNWKFFYQRSARAHTFHMDIGLGWAFAKTEISPAPYLESLYPAIPEMVFDGMGYYNGLFKGRRTVKNQLVPDGINERELHGFDQGLGRRLWYIVKGDVNELLQLINPFHSSRHPDLWRGTGIACGYVGGSDKENLERLLNSSTVFKDQLSTGIALAAISRNASNSVTGDIELACEIICGMSIKEVLSPEACIGNKIIPNYGLSFNLNNLTEK
jgi:enediyne biosynthesis protein E3